jgi:hypothetical protein
MRNIDTLFITAGSLRHFVKNGQARRDKVSKAEAGSRDMWLDLSLSLSLIRIYPCLPDAHRVIKEYYYSVRY